MLDSRESIRNSDKAMIVLLALVALLCILIGASLTAAIYAIQDASQLRADVREWKRDVRVKLDLNNMYLQKQTALLKAHGLPTPEPKEEDKK